MDFKETMLKHGINIADGNKEYGHMKDGLIMANERPPAFLYFFLHIAAKIASMIVDNQPLFQAMTAKRSAIIPVYNQHRAQSSTKIHSSIGTSREKQLLVFPENK